MKFVTAYAGSDVFVGVVHEQKVVHLSKADETIPNTMIECVELGELFIEKVQRVLERVQPEWTYELHDVQLLAPIPRPTKNIFASEKLCRSCARNGKYSGSRKYDCIFESANDSDRT